MPDNLVFRLHAAITESRTVKDHENIFLVVDGVIGKRCRNEGRAHNEYDIGKFLFSQGVQVPKMHKLVTPDMFNGLSSNASEDWFILMQKIKGETIKDLRGIDKKEAIRQRKIELEKVSSLNIRHSDSAYDDNAIFDVKRKKLYLLDFEHWRRL
jgi:tRNA A-37 threonylcarbamoyl transferase component Bud32